MDCTRPSKPRKGVQIDRETQTLATITIQNYFRLYEKLAGMTGTAETEANEFHDIYRLDVNVIPTNQPVRVSTRTTASYKTRREKYNAVIEEIRAAYGKGQPVLVGTASVESSETSQPHAEAAENSRTPCSTRSTTCRRPRSSRAPASTAP